MRPSLPLALVVGVLLTPARPALAAPPPPPPHEDTWLQLDALVHYAFLPDDLLDKAFTQHGRIEGVMPGVEVIFKQRGFNLIGMFGALFITTPDQVWLERDEPKKRAIWVEQQLVLLTVECAFAYEFQLTPWLALMPGVGISPIWVKGGITQYPTEGDPAAPVDTRTRVEQHPGKPLSSFPRKFLPPHVMLRIRVRPTQRLYISVDAGWRLVIYTGLTVGVTIGPRTADTRGATRGRGGDEQ